MKRWSRRVLRGGSFNNQPGNVRCANRDRNQPTKPNANNGFRVALGSVVRQESNRQKRRAACLPPPSEHIHSSLHILFPHERDKDAVPARGWYPAYAGEGSGRVKKQAWAGGIKPEQDS